MINRTNFGLFYKVVESYLGIPAHLIEIKDDSYDTTDYGITITVRDPRTLMYHVGYQSFSEGSQEAYFGESKSGDLN